jgi:hypothetical protein
MPVTPTLLLKLREILGDEAANDLVTRVDQATARELGHLRELAEARPRNETLKRGSESSPLLRDNDARRIHSGPGARSRAAVL